MIEVEPGANPPEELHLISTGPALNQLCEVVWREDRKIGVKFVI